MKTTKGGQVQGRAGEREAGGWDIKWSLYLSKGGREDGDSFKLRETHGSGMIDTGLSIVILKNILNLSTNHQAINNL